MPRKTIEIAVLIARANNFMQQSSDELVRDRLAVFNFVEDFLHANKCYAGFNYLDSAGVENPGKPNVTVKDESRRQIIIHKRIKP